MTSHWLVESCLGDRSERRGTALIAFGLVAVASSTATGQVIDWNNPSGGQWSEAANWNPNNVAGDAPGESARIAIAGTYPVTITNFHPTLDQLLLTNPNATLNIMGGSTLTLLRAAGTNDGLIQVNPGNHAANAVLRFDGSGTLGGTGEILMMTGGDNSQINTGVGAVLTHDAGHLIRGVGQIGADLVNDGVIRADVSVSLFLNFLELLTNDKINNNLMTAEAGTFLDIHTTIDQTLGGVLEANDGAIRTYDGATILGGEINATGAGTLQTAGGTATLTDVTLNTLTYLNAGQTIAVNGAAGLTNNGLIQMNPPGNAPNAVLRFDASGTLWGRVRSR